MNGLVYLAGPIAGITRSDAMNWRKSVAWELAKSQIRCLSPMRDTEMLEPDGVTVPQGYTDPLISDRAVLVRDVFDVRRCDVMLVNFLGANIKSLGTAFEFGAAYILGKPIVSAIEPQNIHRHAMLNEASGYQVGSLADAIACTKSLLGV